MTFGIVQHTPQGEKRVVQQSVHQMLERGRMMPVTKGHAVSDVRSPRGLMMPKPSSPGFRPGVYDYRVARDTWMAERPVVGRVPGDTVGRVSDAFHSRGATSTRMEISRHPARWGTGVNSRVPLSQTPAAALLAQQQNVIGMGFIYTDRDGGAQAASRGPLTPYGAVITRHAQMPTSGSEIMPGALQKTAGVTVVNGGVGPLYGTPASPGVLSQVAAPPWPGSVAMAVGTEAFALPSSLPVNVVAQPGAMPNFGAGQPHGQLVAASQIEDAFPGWSAPDKGGTEMIKATFSPGLPAPATEKPKPTPGLTVQLGLAALVVAYMLFGKKGRR